MTKRKAPAESPDDRTVPHNLEAERAVLGSILVNSKSWPIASQILRPDHFYRRAHQIIYAAFFAIIEGQQNGTVDLVTLKAQLSLTSSLDECGGPSYVSALTDGVPRSANVGHYANIVRETALRRACIDVGNQLVSDGYNSEDSSGSIITRADRAIIDLQRGAGPGRMADLRETAGELYGDLEWLANNQGKLTGIETGYRTINEMTLGWQRGEMIVVAARPSIGKTVFALNTAEAAAATGARVAVFSLEMRRKQLEMRRLSALSGVQLERMRAGQLSEFDYQHIADALGKLHQRPIFVDDRGGQSAWDIRAACRRLKAEGGLDLVVVDYLQLVPGTLDRRGATRNDEMTDISRRLKALADEVQVPLIAVSQLNRAGAGRSSQRPILSDLRESGALEQDADTVCFLHRKDHRESGATELIMEKQRDGPTGTVMLSIDRPTAVFTESDETPEPEEQELAPADATKGKPPNWWKRRRG